MQVEATQRKHESGSWLDKDGWKHLPGIITVPVHQQARQKNPRTDRAG